MPYDSNKIKTFPFKQVLKILEKILKIKYHKYILHTALN